MTLQEWSQEKVIADGLVSLYKPYGISSTALTNIYKKVTQQKVGHGGTLDPLAEGEIILGLGKGTKLLSKFLGHEKTYKTTIVLGISTESGDLELPLSKVEGAQLEQSQLEAILKKLEEGFTQVIPLLSAKKIKGRAAYDLVREGKVPELAPVQTRLISWQLHEFSLQTPEQLAQRIATTKQRLETSYEEFYALGDEINYKTRHYGFMPEKWLNNMNASIELLHTCDSAFRFPVFDLTITVPKGTYIRALATDIAKQIGTTGMLFKLVRVKAV